MLQKISLSNYALVDFVELEFGEGLNVITGETGTGKSILVGAIAALLGEKAAHNAARGDGAKAVLEGWFVNLRHTEIERLLQENEIDPPNDGVLLLRREFHSSGRSRAFINDSPVSTAVLDELAEHLADLHGQHEHQSLLRPRQHLHFLDTFAGLTNLREQVAAAYDEAQRGRQEYAELQRQYEEHKSLRDMESFQLREIKQIHPHPDEENTLTEEIKLLTHAARRSELAQKICAWLSEDEHAIAVRLKTVLDALAELSGIDHSLEALYADAKTAEVALRETAQEMQRYQSGIELDEQRLEQVRQRLADLQKLKRKYGPTLADVMQKWEQLEKSLSRFENFEAELGELLKKATRAEERCAQLALDLSQRRRSAAKQLEKLVPEVLAELGLHFAQFHVRMSTDPDAGGFIQMEGRTVKAWRTGIDLAEFFLSTNRGVEVAPLAKVASGGEVSRVMLALKSIIAERDDIPVLVFDEIDSGVSGRVAQAVGKRLQRLAQSHQIICITHLPQIASAGRHHFLVEKVTSKGRATTRVTRLKNCERPQAVANLLGGTKISETHLKSARELLAEAGNPVE
jgi:DNA repair protein RecN (Recombination protein N)